MKFSLPSVVAIVLCIPAATNAAAAGDPSSTATATRFVDLLQDQHLKEAAAMLATSQAQDPSATEHVLRKIEENLGGFSGMHPILTLPDGKSVKFEVPAHKTVTSNTQKFRQVRYASIANDGQPVFYGLNLTAGDSPPQVLSFGVYLSAADAQSTARANHLVSLINR